MTEPTLVKKGERYSIHKYVGPRGTTWRAVVELSPDPVTGARRQKRLSGRKTRKDLERDIANLLAKDERGGEARNARITVAEYLDRWLALCESDVKPGTFRRYGELTRTWLVPELGQIQVAKLTVADIKRLHETMKKKGRSTTTIQLAHTTLRTALKRAVDLDVEPNPVCSMVKPPRRSAKSARARALTPAEAVAFLAAAEGDDYEPLWRLAIMTGMRRGELLGLRWQDVDLDRGVLMIQHTLVRGKGGRWESGTPKSERGRRNVSISDADVKSLTEYRTRQKTWRIASANWQETGLVFTGADGQAMSANTLDRRYRRQLRKAEIDDTYRLHDLRHAAVTLLLIAGVNINVVSERVGHHKSAFTLDQYGHVIEGLQKDAAETYEKFLKKSAP